MKLVRSHHPPDAEAPVGTFLGEACEKACDLAEQFCPVVAQEVAVVGGLHIFPDVVGDGGPDMALSPGIVGYPAGLTGG